MPTGKPVKATRKLKQHAKQTNARRISRGQKKLTLRHFVKKGQTRKRVRSEFESGLKDRPWKKKRLNENAPIKRVPLGFGNVEPNPDDIEVKNFVADMPVDSEEDESDGDVLPVSLQVRPPKKRLIDEIREHQKQLAELKEQQPEFYEHLKETSGQLLKFGEDVHSDENDDDDDDESDESDPLMDEKEFLLDDKRLESLISQIKSRPKWAHFRPIVSEFNRFVSVSIITPTDSKTSDPSSKKKTQPRLDLISKPVYTKLIQFCFLEIAPLMPSLLNVSPNDLISAKILMKRTKSFTKKGTEVSRTLKTYLKSVYKLLSGISDETLQRLILSHIRDMACIIVALGDLAQRLFIRKSCHLWSIGSPDVRVDAFLALYALARAMDGKHLGKLIKYMYASYVSVCKRVSLRTLPGIKFMINCLAQISLLNPVVTYIDAFHRLRTIAFHVKGAVQTMSKHPAKSVSTKERHQKKLKTRKELTVRSIFNWRFVNILRLWGFILAKHANNPKSDMYLLIYPFIQIILTVLNLSRSALYDPCRLHLLASLLDVIRASQESSMPARRIYVPLLPYFLQILQNPAFCKRPKGRGKSSEQSINLAPIIKVSTNRFNTAILHFALVRKTVQLMTVYFEAYSYAIAFPEMIFAFESFLKSSYLVNPKIPHYLKRAPKTLLSRCKENANWVESKRAQVDFAPRDTEKVDSFLNRERNDRSSLLSKFIRSGVFQEWTHVANVSDLDRFHSKKKTNSSKKQPSKMLPQRKEKKKKSLQRKKAKREREERLQKSRSHIEELVLSD